MGQKRIKLIIVKFLNKEANQDELIILDLWLRNKKNQVLFNQFIKTEYLISSSMDEFDLEKAKITVNKKLKINLRRHRIKQFSKYAAAAAVLVLLLSPFLFNNSNRIISNDTPVTPVISQEAITKGSNKAILTLQNGTNISLEKEENYIDDSKTSNGKELVYNKISTKKQETTYNYLTIPRGGQYIVKLSDGTKVWLNSESKIKYPVNFIDGKTRSIELLYGEAYFEVSPSTNHGGSKFIVHSKSQEIEVLGTKFNIKAYKDDHFTYTTLVEGSVLVNNYTNQKVLTPNLQSIIDVNSSNILISKVNVSEAIAWKNGIFSFKNMPLKDIMKTLSRWYDTQAIFIDPEIEGIKFTGVLGKDQSIQDILTIITNSNNLTYEIKNNTIFLK
ncbi:FecR family protein [Flavivirga rizhaonensis]|uniref:FecR family protein n=1 Tax=Flavivirga rizhaonensis TaxID=2559571 RepID=A0A4V3P4D0_9FLAO|nr:FecR domain-containing protein [Flavivirga rizhaonensis]TGV00954.1 FecR family protein [Flavivirga rizhaonensis]